MVSAGLVCFPDAVTVIGSITCFTAFPADSTPCSTALPADLATWHPDNAGTAKNVEEMLRKYQSHMQRIDRNINQMSARKAETQRNLEQAEDLIARAEKRLGE